jgi:hypothetical protein
MHILRHAERADYLSKWTIAMIRRERDELQQDTEQGSALIFQSVSSDSARYAAERVFFYHARSN